MTLSIHSIALLLHAVAPDAATVGTPASAPVCETPSHERLTVRPDRDVCAPTLNRAGRPIAMGLLPTRCRDDARTYRIDAIGPHDRCVAAR